MTQILFLLTYKRSKLCHEMALLTHFLPNCVFILVFTVFASIVSGFWLFLFITPTQKSETSAQGTKSSAFVHWTSSQIFSGGYKKKMWNLPYFFYRQVKLYRHYINCCYHAQIILLLELVVLNALDLNIGLLSSPSPKSGPLRPKPKMTKLNLIKNHETSHYHRHTYFLLRLRHG